MATINARRLEFVRNPGDVKSTGSVVLDPSGPPYAITMYWRPVAGLWFLSLRLATGAWVVRNVALRDRTDCLMGVSAPSRPAGALISYDPKRRGDPGLHSYTRDDVRLYYLPGGFVPEDFSAYVTDVT